LTEPRDWPFAFRFARIRRYRHRFAWPDMSSGPGWNPRSQYEQASPSMCLVLVKDADGVAIEKLTIAR
jgi:hypothetical protein